VMVSSMAMRASECSGATGYHVPSHSAIFVFLIVCGV
jgi:hypothetical protein